MAEKSRPESCVNPSSPNIHEPHPGNLRSFPQSVARARNGRGDSGAHRVAHAAKYRGRHVTRGGAVRGVARIWRRRADQGTLPGRARALPDMAGSAHAGFALCGAVAAEESWLHGYGNDGPRVGG